MSKKEIEEVYNELKSDIIIIQEKSGEDYIKYEKHFEEIQDKLLKLEQRNQAKLESMEIEKKQMTKGKYFRKNATYVEVLYINKISKRLNGIRQKIWRELTKIYPTTKEESGKEKLQTIGDREEKYFFSRQALEQNNGLIHY